ncbi:response regulator transcription factor [Candidatus Chloroploca sp. M-50]|uniref:Response regulator transcription factor n=1 Tax=Candidatus Chloroploca mongolica TaxID=2528176 RepID=A0ABS4D978_9CHLR|nr:response regulator transcription factor [Candidatus Chloroploca mongolica]MBP1465969.1 response regulator transcription factor [Candidatus Chloroploca mongolica]
MGVLTIVLADDHAVVRAGLRALLENEMDCSVVGEAGNGPEALALVERLQPSLLVVDLMMPGLSGLEVARQARQISSGTRIIILSMHSDESYVREALRVGVTAYVLKEALSNDFLYALHQAASGRRYLSPPLSEKALDAYASQTAETTLDLYETLTAREREILYLAAQGMTSAEIAERLMIGVRTVDTHRASMMRKLGLHTPLDLIRYAVRRGIVSLDS